MGGLEYGTLQQPRYDQQNLLSAQNRMLGWFANTFFTLAIAAQTLIKLRMFQVITSFDCARGLSRAACTAVAFSADGNTAALGYKNHVVAVWDCRAGKQTVQRLATRDLHEDAITSLAFAPGSAAPGTPLRLLSAGRDSCLRVFDARSAGREAEALTLTCPGFRIRAPTTKVC